MTMIDLTEKEKRLAERVDMSVAGALEVSDAAGGVGFSNASQVMEFAKMMALSQIGVRKHLRGNPGACLAVCVQAIEWGMSPYAVANKSYSVNDQLAFESQLVQAVILKRAPIKGRFKVEFTGEGDRRVCRVYAVLKDDGEIVEYVSPPFGKITPKNSPLWKSDPDQQQFYYSGRALCRRHFPDILLGVYTEDELPAPVGPDLARDVTPPRGLSNKLDVLAASSQVDPETGEITDDAFDDGVAEHHETSASEADQDRDNDRELFPGDAASTAADPQPLDPIAVARRRGAVDRQNGSQRRALPAEYRDKGREAEARAWQTGWDNSDDVLAEA